jgi:catechol 2,3-dioxygenase-like lactoylglutathione lyase family enzyme
MTVNLQRFIDFYVEVFEVEQLFREDTPAFRHAILRAGSSSWLHPVEVTGNSHGEAIPEMFARGHLDHIALGAPSRAAFEKARARLTVRGCSSGVIESLGAFQAIWFSDPDGMRGELTLITDPNLREFHAPRPVP